MVDAKLAMKPIVVSFWTADADYRDHAKRLKAECDALGIEHCIEERPSAGGYLENCCQKPFFIREMLERHQRPVLWIDVDASILRQPVWVEKLPEKGYDMAARPHQRPHWRRFHVGTLWFNTTAAEFLDRWCAQTGALSDESALDEVFKAGVEVSVAELPRAYFVLPGTREANPCIVHRISSWPGKDAQRHRFGKVLRTA